MQGSSKWIKFMVYLSIKTSILACLEMLRENHHQIDDIFADDSKDRNQTRWG